MKFLRSLTILCLIATAATAQTPAPTPRQNSEIPIFRAKLPGGTYEVAVRSMIAVTQHEYLVDGVARVTEVNIDTAGTLLVRFYFLEPVAPTTGSGLANAGIEQAQRLLREAAEKSGQDVWKKVVKNYPTTTHARTVEYRVESLEQLTKIFDAADGAFRLQKDTRITLGGE
jgi:hypothetical protein